MIDDKIQQCEADIKKLQETLAELKQEKDSIAPISVGTFLHKPDRLILDLHKVELDSIITDRDDGYRYVSLNANGKVCGHVKTYAGLHTKYRNIKPAF